MSDSREMTKADAAAPSQHLESFVLADEQKIVTEIGKRVTEKFIYKINGGREIGLSYSGTNWAVREYAKHGEIIRIVDGPRYQQCPIDPEYIIVTVISQRFVRHPETGVEIPLDSAPGVKRMWKNMKKKIYEGDRVVGEEIVSDPEFISKCASKATRNSKQALIPVDVVKQLINKALGTRPVPEGAAQAGKPQTPPGAQQGPNKGTPAKPPQKDAGKAAPPATGAAAPAGTVPAGAALAAGTSTQPAQKAADQKAAAPAQPKGAAPAAEKKAATAPAAAKPKGATPIPKDVLIQKFDASLKQALGTQDAEKARGGLKKLTGTANASEIPEEKLRALGNLLMGVIKKTHKISENQVLRISDGEMEWQGPEIPADPAPEPQAEAAPEEAPAEEMF